MGQAKCTGAVRWGNSEGLTAFHFHTETKAEVCSLCQRTTQAVKSGLVSTEKNPYCPHSQSQSNVKIIKVPN